VIEPSYFDLKRMPANDDHPSHDVANGQKFVKEVYEALRASPQWNETLLVITYDEHGGFYDHVKTPYVNIPSPDGNTGPAPSFFKFDRLGVRVPTIMVSPWIKKGTGKFNFLLHVKFGWYLMSVDTSLLITLTSEELKSCSVVSFSHIHFLLY
jgi:phospholipase C